jgi:hypothetical protein
MYWVVFVGENKGIGVELVLLVVERMRFKELLVGDECQPLLGDALQSEKGFQRHPDKDLT